MLQKKPIADNHKNGYTNFLSPSLSILILFSLWLLYWFHIFLDHELQSNTDLFGHIAMVERLGAAWWHNPIVFYDRAWFTGWPAFQFYGFVAHLIAWVVSMPLSFITTDSARLAIYVVSVVQLTTLHWSVFYAAKPFFSEVTDSFNGAYHSEGLHAVVVCVFTFWFLNQDGATAGVGASAILGAGLYSQLLGWHLLLLYVGLLGRILSNSNKRQVKVGRSSLPILLATMICAHTLTTLYALFFGVLAFLRFSERRWFLLQTHLIGLGLSAFWLLPMIALNSDYGVNHTEPPVNSFLSTIFRYPWIDLARSFRGIFQGQFPVFSALELIIPLLMLLLFMSPRLGQWRITSNFSVFILIGLVLFSSPFLATALPLGIHYYRLDSYAILLLLPLLSAAPFVYKLSPVVRSSILLGASLVALSTILLPSRELGFVHATNKEKAFTDQQQVINYFKGKEGVGRVLFDHFIDYKIFSPLTPHYMSSNLFKESGIETINGVFIQSSVAYQFPIAMAIALGLEHYTAPLPFTNLAKINTADATGGLRRYGVTHIVSFNGPHLAALSPFLAGPTTQFGPYIILPLRATADSIVSAVKSPIVGYFDQSGSLPFRLIEYFFFEHANLRNNFEVIELSDSVVIPAGISVLLFNGTAEKAQQIAIEHPDLNVVDMNFIPLTTIDHYNIHYNYHRGPESYIEARPYLEHVLQRLQVVLDKALLEQKQNYSSKPISLRWFNADQEFALEGLEPGQMVRINYSYFPFWSTRDGVLFRGSSERMIFLPNSQSAHFSYSRWQIGASWWGMFITIVCVVLLFYFRYSSYLFSSRTASIHGVLECAKE